MLHVLEHLREIGERDLAGDEIGGRDLSAGHGVEGFANEARGVVESRFERDFRIVQRRRIKAHLGGLRATAEQVHRGAAAGHLHRPLPGERRADRFDYRVGPAATLGELADQRDGIRMIVHVERGPGAHVRGRLHLALALADGDDAHATHREHPDEHQADWPAADHDGSVTGQRADFVDAAQDAGERLDQGGIGEGNVAGDLEHVFADDPAGDAHELGVGAVVEQQVLAEVLPAPQAEEAGIARRGIRRNHAHADANPVRNLAAHFRDHPGEFVAEDGRWNNHARMRTLFPDLEVRAAGERHLDLEQNFVFGQGRYRHLFHFQIFGAVKHRGAHVRAENGSSH